MEIKSTYKSIPGYYFLYYLKKAEWKIKNKNLNFSVKLDDFIEMYYMNKYTEDVEITDDYFLNNYQINSNFNIMKKSLIKDSIYY